MNELMGLLVFQPACIDMRGHEDAVSQPLNEQCDCYWLDEVEELLVCAFGFERKGQSVGWGLGEDDAIVKRLLVEGLEGHSCTSGAGHDCVVEGCWSSKADAG